jgi:methionine-rich copper-binding protein CopC
MCSPYNATAGIGESITARAHLDGTPKVRDSVLILTNVVQRYELESFVPETIVDLYPGQSYQMNTTVSNLGNGQDRYDITIESIVDNQGGAHVWDIDIPRILFEELNRNEAQTVPIYINVPVQTLAGEYAITFNVLSEEPFPCTEDPCEGTKVQNQIVIRATIIEFHDMQISLDPTVESKIKTTAPSRIVRYTVNVSNYGNVEDQPTIHNHTYDDVTNTWSVRPGLGALSTWKIDYALLEGFGTEFPLEKPCVELTVKQENEITQQLSQGDGPDYCYVTAGNTLTLPMMQPYTTLQLVVIVTVAPDAALTDRNIGIKVLSMYGSSDQGGDFDETEVWTDSCTLDSNSDGLPDNLPPDCDTNEQVLEMRLRAPDLVLESVIAPIKEAAIGEMLSINVFITNRGNAHATDINIILCKDQSASDIKRNGCKEENIVYRQIINAIMPIGQSDTDQSDPITLLYMVEPGNHDIVVVVDPDNTIVETDENNNIEKVGTMKSPLGSLDVGRELVIIYAVPAIIIGATFSLFGVAGFVIWGRRIEALARFSELSSLLPGSNDDDMVF